MIADSRSALDHDDALRPPRAPFAKHAARSRKTPKKGQGASDSPRMEHGLFLHDGASSSSLQPPASPASLTRTLTPGSEGGRRTLFGRRSANKQALSTPPETTRSSPATSVSFASPTRYEQASSAEPATPPERLIRKKSSASLLYHGMTRSLNRVGSAMRRAPPPPPPREFGGSSFTSASSSRHLGSQGGLDNLCEESEELEGSPMQGSPMQGSPMQGSPMQGSPMDFGTSRPRAIPIPLPVSQLQPFDSDPDVSRPFNVKHNLHVNEELDGLPREWLEQLKAQGLSESDLLLINAASQRQRAVALHPIAAAVVPSSPAYKQSTPSPTLQPEAPPQPQAELELETPPVPPPKRASSLNPSLLKSPSLSTLSSGKSQFQQGFKPSSPIDIKHRPPPLQLSPPPATTLPLLVPSTMPTPRTPPRTSSQTSSPRHVNRLDAPPSAFALAEKSNYTPGSVESKRSLLSPQLSPQRSPVSGELAKRPASLIGKLLDDLDAKSARSYRRASSIVSAGAPSAGYLGTPDMLSIRHQIGSRLREFREMDIGDSEDCWAEDLLATWNGDNPFVRSHDTYNLSLYSPQRIPQATPAPQPDIIALAATPLPSPAPAVVPAVDVEGLVPAPLGRKRSHSSPRIPNVELDEGDDASLCSTRRRSKSLGEGVQHSPIYSPPPPKRPIRSSARPDSPLQHHSAPLRTSFGSFGVRRVPSGSSADNELSQHLLPSGGSLTGPRDSHTDDCERGNSPNSSECTSSLDTPSDILPIEKDKPPSLLSAASAASAARPPSQPTTPLMVEDVKRFSALPLPPVPVVQMLASRHIPAQALLFQREAPSVPSSASSFVTDPTSPWSTSEADADTTTYYTPQSSCFNCSRSDAGRGVKRPCPACETQHHRESVLSSHSVQSLNSMCSRSSSAQSATLSRISSVASTVSYSLHEPATVERAYTRVLRRVPESDGGTIRDSESQCSDFATGTEVVFATLTSRRAVV